MTLRTSRFVALPDPDPEEYPGANIMAASLRIRERARAGECCPHLADGMAARIRTALHAWRERRCDWATVERIAAEAENFAVALPPHGLG